MKSADQDVRRIVYDRAIEDGHIPTKSELSQAAQLSLGQVDAALQRLADGHVLVLQPQSGEILMANPFSAVPTPFEVRIGSRSWYANCIWDAMGIPAMLHAAATLEASCGCCGSAIHLEMPADCTDDDPRVAHFPIRAAHWWDDIVFN